MFILLGTSADVMLPTIVSRCQFVPFRLVSPAVAAQAVSRATGQDPARCRMAVAVARGGKILLAGNGGSAADAQHWAAEFVNRFLMDRPPLPAIALTTDSSVLTSIGNDFGYDYIFSRYVEAVGREGDVLLGISTSGNSGNVIKAITAAREKGMKVITLTGKDGGKMAGSADIEIRVPHFGYADRIQEIHIKVIHILIQLIEKEMVK
mgnify:CR=1 FL=1